MLFLSPYFPPEFFCEGPGKDLGWALVEHYYYPGKKKTSLSLTALSIYLTHFLVLAGGIGCDGPDKGQSRKCLDAVEIYNVDANFWRDGPPMPYPLLSLRSNSSSAGSVEGKLYVCGGYRGAGRC